MSFVQLYNEQLLDLLDEDSNVVRSAGTTSGSMGFTSQGFQRSLPVRWNKGDGFYAEGLTHFPVSEAEQTMELFRKGTLGHAPPPTNIRHSLTHRPPSTAHRPPIAVHVELSSLWR